MIRIFTLNYTARSPTAIFNINININKSLLGPQSSIDIYLYFWLYREYEEVVGEEDNIIEAILILYNTVSATSTR